MRSIGLLEQNQNPWPPYKQPEKHHPAYQDPRRALLSKLFHSVVWHSLYRFICYKDVSEHSLSLLVYLLDQAWMCYESSQSTDLNLAAQDSYKHKLYIDDSLYNKRRCIKIERSNVNMSDNAHDPSSPFLLLNHWYEHDDLVYNLCTTITQIELPPPYLKYYFGPDDSNDTKMSAATGLANNLLDYFTSNSSSTSLSSSPSNSQSSNTETGEKYKFILCFHMHIS